ncbi:MAG: serine/threonine protein kinase [Deltaproteobacteria bacterium]|nr:MAG: serine/threonine protein kinase [Deltaproteobacteria bacterium]
MGTPRAIDAGVRIGEIFVDKYRIDAIVGHGGMGVVALCTHLSLNERVAIKMLRRDVIDDADAVERFMREAQAAVKLKSEFVARVTDVGRSPTNVPYMVMEYLQGQDLGDLLDQRGRLGVPWAIELTLQACEALAEAHSLHIVHRDIKPTNLFITWRPDGSTLLKVLDFGISKALTGKDIALTQTQSLLGTPAYMSPEQMRSARNVDARTDIWSLGTVLYEMLEGHRPFEAESFSEMCVKFAVDPPAVMTDTPPTLQDIVLHCLEKGPEQRYQSMAELARALVPFSHDPHQAQVLTERMARTLRRSQAQPAARNPSTSVSASRPLASPARATPLPGPAVTPPPGPAVTPPPGLAVTPPPGPAVPPLPGPSASASAMRAAAGSAPTLPAAATVPATAPASAIPVAGAAPAIPGSGGALHASGSAAAIATAASAAGEPHPADPLFATGRLSDARTATSARADRWASSITDTMAVARPRRHVPLIAGVALTAAVALGVTVLLARGPSSTPREPRIQALPPPPPPTDRAAVDPSSPPPDAATDPATSPPRAAGDPAASSDHDAIDAAGSADRATGSARPDRRGADPASRPPGAPRSTRDNRGSAAAAPQAPGKPVGETVFDTPHHDGWRDAGSASRR